MTPSHKCAAYGFLWFPLDSYGFLWIPMGSPAKQNKIAHLLRVGLIYIVGAGWPLAQGYVKLRASQDTQMESGLLLDVLYSYGFLWIPRDSYGFDSG